MLASRSMSFSIKTISHRAIHRKFTSPPHKITGLATIPQREAKPKPLALTPEQLAASNANLAAIRNGVKKAAAGEKLEVTPEPEPETPENLGVKQPPEELPIADARPHLTQAEIRALTQPETDDTWSEAVKGMLLALGAVVAFIWLAAVGIGGNTRSLHSWYSGGAEGIAMVNHQAGLIRAIVLFALSAILIACSGCSEQPSIYGAASDTARGGCQAQGAVAMTHFSHGGWTSDCSEAFPE